MVRIDIIRWNNSIIFTSVLPYQPCERLRHIPTDTLPFRVDHSSPLLLKAIADSHPTKMMWASNYQWAGSDNVMYYHLASSVMSPDISPNVCCNWHPLNQFRGTFSPTSISLSVLRLLGYPPVKKKKKRVWEQYFVELFRLGYRRIQRRLSTSVTFKPCMNQTIHINIINIMTDINSMWYWRWSLWIWR